MTKKELIDSLQDVPNDAEVYITEKWWYTDEVKATYEYYREATTDEIAEWKEYKRKQEEELGGF